jgi:hypothetical protein
MASPNVVQSGLELLDSSNPSTSPSHVPGLSVSFQYVTISSNIGSPHYRLFLTVLAWLNPSLQSLNNPGGEFNDLF